jgi:hypothetical protein
MLYLFNCHKVFFSVWSHHHTSAHTRGSQKASRILWDKQFGASGVCTAGTECYWSCPHANLQRCYRSFLHASLEVVVWQVAGTVVSASQCTYQHVACCAAIFDEEYLPVIVQPPVSGSHSEWIVGVPYFENGPQGDIFH